MRFKIFVLHDSHLKKISKREVMMKLLLSKVAHPDHSPSNDRDHVPKGSSTQKVGFVSTLLTTVTAAQKVAVCRK